MRVLLNSQITTFLKCELKAVGQGRIHGPMDYVGPDVHKGLSASNLKGSRPEEIETQLTKIFEVPQSDGETELPSVGVVPSKK